MLSVVRQFCQLPVSCTRVSQCSRRSARCCLSLICQWSVSGLSVVRALLSVSCQSVVCHWSKHCCPSVVCHSSVTRLSVVQALLSVSCLSIVCQWSALCSRGPGRPFSWTQLWNHIWSAAMEPMPPWSAHPPLPPPWSAPLPQPPLPLPGAHGSNKREKSSARLLLDPKGGVDDVMVSKLHVERRRLSLRPRFGRKPGGDCEVAGRATNTVTLVAPASTIIVIIIRFHWHTMYHMYHTV